MTDTTDSTSEQGKQAAGEVAQHAKGKMADVADTAKDEARSIANDARDQAADVLGTARSELRAQAADQAKTLSSTLSDIGRQLGDMANGSSEPEAQVAQLARSAADSLSKRAERIDEGGIDGVVDDVKRFARNRPGAFLLGAVAVGFAVGRLGKHADLQQAADRAKGEFDADQLAPSSEDTTASATSKTLPPTGPDSGGVTS